VHAEIQLPLFPEARRAKRSVARTAKAAKRNPGRKLKVAGLFAGIGGIELGLSRAGHESKLLCEIDEAALAVLKVRFPEVSLHTDVTKLERLPKGIELLTAGFPCQDLSQAGKTKGIAGSRSGLVGEVFRLLRTQKVPWVLIENVPFMLQLGKGEALEVIVAALEELGYRWAYRVVDSRSFGLPQRRRRVYMLASLEHDPREVLFADDAKIHDRVEETDWRKAACGFYWTEGQRGLGWAYDAVPTLKGGSTIGIPSSPAILMPTGKLVTPDIRDAERMQGFDPGWTEPAEQVKKKGFRWKLVGNAVSVDAAAWIGRRLAEPGAYDDTGDPELRKVSAWPTAAYNVDGVRRTPRDLSEWAFDTVRVPLTEFLVHETSPLSSKAARGFYRRASEAKLTFPPGFLDAIRRHSETLDQERSARTA
jgi:DNA (cytosine-5)-methyltransferase 1